MDEILGLFLEESVDHLEAATRGYLDLEVRRDPEIIEEILRPLHTLKGASAMVGLDGFSRIVHGTEEILTGFRSERLPFNETLLGIVFEAIGELREAVDRMKATEVPVPNEEFEALRMKLDLFAAPAEEAPASGASHASGETGEVGDAEWNPGEEIALIPDFLSESREILGGLSHVALDLAADPSRERLDALFRGLHTLKGSSGVMGLERLNRLCHALEDLLDKVRSGDRPCGPEMEELLLASLDRIEAILRCVEQGSGVGGVYVEDLLHEAKRLAEGEEDRPAQACEAPGAGAAPEAGATTLAGAGTRARESGESADRPAGTAPARGRAESLTLRIDVGKLDRMMNLVGEIAIGRIRLEQRVRDLSGVSTSLEELRRTVRRENPTGQAGAEIERTSRLMDDLLSELGESVDRFGYLSTELQEAVMRMRMVPIGQLFQRFPRTVRDLAKGRGKKIRTVLEGEETEIDKRLIEALADPFLHLIRNSVDHGVEPPADRIDAGKPEEAKIGLSARHQGGEVIVEIFDDGRGIDPRRIREAVAEKGLLPREQAGALSDEEAIQWIFAPGFSTAREVTDISGRGVGLDVVRDGIARVKGSVEVQTRVGEGTRFVIRLPLTLAIIQVLLVGSAGEVFALPLSGVQKTLQLDTGDFRRVGSRPVAVLAGRAHPVSALASLLGVPVSSPDGAKETPAVFLSTAAAPVILLVDRLLGKQEVVIKALGACLERVPLVSGATILGNGKVVPILDVAALSRRISDRVEENGAALPRAVGHAEAGAVAEADASAGPAVPAVLVVDDSATVRTALRKVFESLGFRASEAEDGSAGLRAAAEKAFDLVSTDVMMPNCDGYEFVQALRKTPGYRDTPVVMISSRGERIDKMRGFEAGVDEYLSKPAEPGMIAEVVRRLGLPIRRSHESGTPA